MHVIVVLLVCPLQLQVYTVEPLYNYSGHHWGMKFVL